MIQKRFQHWGDSGKEWTKWFDYRAGGQTELESLRAEEPMQFKGLKNEFRLKPEEA